MTETLTDHLITQRGWTYFFVGITLALAFMGFVLLIMLAKVWQLLKGMVRKCEKMQKQIGQITVGLGRLEKSQEIEQRTNGNRNANKNSMKVVQPERERESVTDGLYNALNRMQDKLDAQEQELREYRARDSGGGGGYGRAAREPR